MNTVAWDPTGTTLITGSDDTRILLFDITGRCLRRIDSGHVLNIFSAECITPSLVGGQIVSCGGWPSPSLWGDPILHLGVVYGHICASVVYICVYVGVCVSVSLCVFANCVHVVRVWE